MNDLIKIENTTIGNETTPTINARELHEFLEVRSKFADWISRRIKDYGFLEDKDYTIVSQKKETITANNEARVTTLNEYHISLDMAKELAGEAAKILKYRGTGRNNLFKFLRKEGILMKNNAPKQEYINKGWFKLVEYKVNGEVKIKTLVYQKGLDGIRKMLNEAGLLPENR